MKASIFVIFSSVFFAAWLGTSYVTALKPEPALGLGSRPLAKEARAKQGVAQPLIQSVEKEIATNSR